MLVIVCITSGLSVTVQAGVEPSPFRPEEGKLFAISNSLGASNLAIKNLVGRCLDSSTATGFLEGKINQMQAIKSNLALQNKRLDEILPNLPRGVLNINDHYGLVSFLYSIYYNSRVLQTKTEYIMNIFPEFHDPLEDVSELANNICWKVYEKIPYLV